MDKGGAKAERGTLAPCGVTNTTDSEAWLKNFIVLISFQLFCISCTLPCNNGILLKTKSTHEM